MSDNGSLDRINFSVHLSDDESPGVCVPVYLFGSSQRPRDRLRDRLRVGSRQPINERAPCRLILEADIGKRDAIRVFDGEGLATLANAKRQSVRYESYVIAGECDLEPMLVLRCTFWNGIPHQSASDPKPPLAATAMLITLRTSTSELFETHQFRWRNAYPVTVTLRRLFSAAHPCAVRRTIKRGVLVHGVPASALFLKLPCLCLADTASLADHHYPKLRRDRACELC